jgi:hypothetical protein
MKSRKKITDLVSLLKVFDVNFVNDKDAAQLSGLDVNSEVDIRKAINALLIPEFFLYLVTAQGRMLDSLRAYLSDDAEDFSALFDQIELAFDEPLVDRRRFMTTILDALESVKN